MHNSLLSKALNAGVLLSAFLVIPIAAYSESIPDLSATIKPSTTLVAGPAHSFLPPSVDPDSIKPSQVSAPEFRSTLSKAQYDALKRAAAEESPNTAGRHNGISGVGPQSTIGSPKVNEGVNEVGAKDFNEYWTPPDTNGAIGISDYVEIVNDAVAIYKRDGSLIKVTPLTKFFGYSTEALFDPQVKYDRFWNRFILSATAFQESSTVQYYYFAISQTSDPTGPYWTYRINAAFHTNDFWDFEKNGLTQDAVLFDANIFNGSAYNGATFFAVPKANLYNGFGFSVPVFTGLKGTLTLPDNRTASAVSYLIYNIVGASTIGLYALYNSSDPRSISLSAPFTIDAGVVENVPRAANQPGDAASIDTSDTRFSNNSVQIYDNSTGHTLIYAANCIADAGYPTVHLITLDITASTGSSLYFYVSSTSDDFNPHVAVNDAGDVALEWSTLNSSLSIYDSIAVSDRLYGTGFGASTIISNKSIKTPYLDFRWGDYSSLTVDPTNLHRFWGTNEYVIGAHEWGTKNFTFLANP